jgi:hypothetical protein
LFIQFLKNTALLLSRTHINTLGPKMSWVHNLKHKIMQDLRFSQQCYWSSNFLGCDTVLSRKQFELLQMIVILSPLESSSLFSLNCFTLRMRALQFFKILGTVYPTAQHTRKLESSTQYNIQWNWITTF